MCGRLDIDYEEETLNYLIENHYRKTGRPFRACQPRDRFT